MNINMLDRDLLTDVSLQSAQLIGLLGKTVSKFNDGIRKILFFYWQKRLIVAAARVAWMSVANSGFILKLKLVTPDSLRSSRLCTII